MGEKDVISKTELAALLGFTKPRITQLIRKGLPVLADGQIDRKAALDWHRKYCSGHRGGWGPHGRQTRAMREQAEAKQAQPADDYSDLSDYGRGAVDMANYLRLPAHIAAFAEVMAAHGCTAAQSAGAAQAIGMFVGIWTADIAAKILGKPDASVVRIYDEQPNWQSVAEITGERIDVDAWTAASRRAMRAWTQRERETARREK